MFCLHVVHSTVHSREIMDRLIMAKYFRCILTPGNGKLSKLHVNKAHFYLRVQKENAQCLSNYIGAASYFSGMDRYSDFLQYVHRFYDHVYLHDCALSNSIRYIVSLFLLL